MDYNFKIAGINISFQYRFRDYFYPQINEYKTCVSPEFYIQTKLLDKISLPEGVLLKRYHDHYIYLNEFGLSLVELKSQDIVKRIDVDADRKWYCLQLKNKVSNIADVEYIETGKIFSDIALRNRILTLHASAIAYNNKAILFSAPSQVGKSTQASLWCKYGDNCTIINDDKPLIYFKNNRLYACGSPWAGKKALNNNVEYEVLAIVFLRQGFNNRVIKLSTEEKVIEIMRNVYRSYNTYKSKILTTMIDKMINSTDLFLYECKDTYDSFLNLYKYFRF